MLEAVLPLFELDSYSDAPLIMMAAVTGDELDPTVESSYLENIHLTNPDAAPVRKHTVIHIL